MIGMYIATNGTLLNTWLSKILTIIILATLSGGGRKLDKYCIIPDFNTPSVNMNNPIKNSIVGQSILLTISLLFSVKSSKIDEVTKEPSKISILKKLKEKIILW